jgi:hypothetical protein
MDMPNSNSIKYITYYKTLFSPKLERLESQGSLLCLCLSLSLLSLQLFLPGNKPFHLQTLGAVVSQMVFHDNDNLSVLTLSEEEIGFFWRQQQQ